MPTISLTVCDTSLLRTISCQVVTPEKPTSLLMRHYKISVRFRGISLWVQWEHSLFVTIIALKHGSSPLGHRLATIAHFHVALPPLVVYKVNTPDWHG